MRRRGVLFVRSAIANVAVHDNQCRHFPVLPEPLKRRPKTVAIIGISNPFDIPAIGSEPRADILGECEAGVAFDRDVVAIVNPAEISQ